MSVCLLVEMMVLCSCNSSEITQLAEDELTEQRGEEKCKTDSNIRQACTNTED